MRNLQINPTDHEIFIACDIEKDSPDVASISIQLSAKQESATGIITASEAEKISKWFASLAKELGRK